VPLALKLVKLAKMSQILAKMRQIEYNDGKEKGEASGKSDLLWLYEGKVLEILKYLK
jgi:hypothetical protein